MSLLKSDKVREYHREYYKKNKERIRGYPSQKRAMRKEVLKRHNITEEQYNVLLTAQNGCCAICEHPPKKKRLAIDHDHKTGSNRGLLCWKCNLGLGMWNDSAERHL